MQSVSVDCKKNKKKTSGALKVSHVRLVMGRTPAQQKEDLYTLWLMERGAMGKKSDLW